MGFGLFGIMFGIVFIVIIGVFIVTAVQGICQWNKNNHSPRLTVAATVVSKRTAVTYHQHGGVNEPHHHHASTWYYVTFQVQSGDRMEMQLSGPEYGMLAEGDVGMLSFQGTRYLGFERQQVAG